MTALFRWLVTVALVAAGGDAALGRTLKLGTIAPKDSAYYDILRDMGEDWKRISGGELELRIYTSGVGDESDILRAMNLGQFQMAAISGGGLPDLIPELRALQMPMMLASDEERDYVGRRVHPELERLAEERGYKILGWVPTGWLYFYTNEPVVTPEDLKRLKVFAWAGNSGYIEAWKASGFHPVPLPVTEVLTALQTGLIDAIAVPPLAALSFQWFGSANHMTDVKWVSLEGAIIMPAKIWREFPADVQPALLASAQQAVARLAASLRQWSDDAVVAMRGHGLVVHAVPSEVVHQWEQAARAGYPRLIGNLVAPKWAREVERLRDEYRTLHAAP
ncbi:MAG: TRAP transporter substrate-binding protein DctP [Alphaproteobacteria bacterium]